MNDILQYLLKWSIALAVVFLFYRIALRPLTFYQWNRRYLIMYSLVAFLIPFINLNTYVQPQQLQESALVQFIPAISIQANDVATTAEPSLNILLIAGLVILAGSIILSARLIVQWYSLHRIRKHAVRVYHPEATVYHVDENVIPFSFGSAIYVNTSLHTETELNDIILHEFVHVRQKHSFDIIWSEVLCILNWYNPFAWGIRHAIRQNLEFIADQAVLQHGLDKKTYQYHLLKVIGSPQYSIANNFNFSSLKKRIAMMNRLKSARVHLVKFLFVLPLLAILLVAFRQNENWYQDITITDNRDELDKSDTSKKPVKQDVEIRIVHMKEFYNMNPSVKEVAWSADEEIVIYRKDGKREAYHLKDDEEMKKYMSLYKAIPSVISKMLIPPPPPHKVKEGEVMIEDVVPSEKITYYVDEDHFTINYKMITRKDPNVDRITVSDKELIIKMKDGATETYNMSNDADIKRFEKKYGKMPPLPPAPPKEPAEVEIIDIPTPAIELPKGVESVEVVEKVVTVTRTDGARETYNLSKPAEKAAMEKKYGEVIMIDEVPVSPTTKIAITKPVIIKTVPSKTNATPSKPVIIEAKPLPTQKSAPAKPSIKLSSEENSPASVKVVQDDGEQVLYADKIVVNTGIPEWRISAKEKAKPVYYLNGKRAADQDPNTIVKIESVSHMEILSDVETLKAKGETNYNAILNIITKENTYNKSAYLAKESRQTVEEAKIKSELINTLILEQDNPLDIKVEGVRDENIEVEMTGGKIFKKDGRYYARPTTTGNIQIRIYKKVEGKDRQIINKRIFRVIQSKVPVT